VSSKLDPSKITNKKFQGLYRNQSTAKEDYKPHTTYYVSEKFYNKKGFIQYILKIGKLKLMDVKVKQSRYRPGVAQRFPGSYGAQIS
jgi:hypothetical protein